jgi:hypothetical protein
MNERGHTLIDAIWSMGIAGIILSTTLTLFTSISRLTAIVSGSNQGIIASMKVNAALTNALRVLERNRLAFAAQVTPGASMTLPHGGPHPLSSLSGSTAPLRTSDIVSIIDIAHRHRGTVTTSSFSGTSVDADICNLYSKIPTNEFKSYLLYTLDGVKQIVGEISYRGPSCIHLSGSSIRGVVSPQAEIVSHPMTFVPVEREYSLFIDRGSIFRIASHVGGRITENQPIIRGITSISVTPVRQPQGATLFTLRIQPVFGPLVTTFIIPGLSQRMLWNEILP